MYKYNSLEEIKTEVAKKSLMEVVRELSGYPYGEFVYDLALFDGRIIYHFAYWTATEEMIRNTHVKNLAYDDDLWHIEPGGFIRCTCRNCKPKEN